MKSEKINTVHVSKDSEEVRAEGRCYMTRPEKAKRKRCAKARPYTGNPYIAKPNGAKGDSRATSERAKEGVVDAKIVDAKQVWTQLEDQAVPRLRLSLIDRAVYAHLLRLSRLEGKVRVHFSIASVGRGTCLSGGSVRKAVRHLATLGARRLVQRSKSGHVAEVRLPEEIRAARRDRAARREASRMTHGLGHRLEGCPVGPGLEETDFMESKALRQAIHSRESGCCFYCLRRVPPTVRCLDHVVPRARSGRNGNRNLVSCCMECNSQKGEKSAGDYVLWLYRDRRLTAMELAGRLRALDALAAGKLRPATWERTTR